ncbi:MAG: serine hydrolase, partial [Allomuricauda sp.]
MNAFFSNIKKWLSNFGAKSIEDLQGLERVDAMFAVLASDARIPGMSVTIIKKGQQFLEKGYGYANLDDKIPVDPKTTLFRIA